MSLGNTIDQIAWHKAGIFKPGSPAFAVHQAPEAEDVLVRRAVEKGASLKWVNYASNLHDVKIRPPETFQFLNASLALALSTTVLKRLNPDLSLHTQTGDLCQEVVHGLENVVWRGRCETKRLNNETFYLDVAHNEESLKVVCSWFGKIASSTVCCHLSSVSNAHEYPTDDAIIHLQVTGLQRYLLWSIHTAAVPLRRRSGGDLTT